MRPSRAALLKSKYGEAYGAKVAVTAATGIAATHISGTTLHTQAGCGVPQTMQDFGKMNSAAAAARWRALDVLLIDEVSMISAELFSAIERGARAIRGNALPWGGVQLVVCGDFCQLPPIERRPGPGLPKARALAALAARARAADAARGSQDAFMNRGFAFQSPVWHKCGMQEVILTKVFRQADEDFVAILNDLREGRGQTALAALAQRCARPLPSVHGIQPTELYARNADVDTVNAAQLRMLDTPLHEYHAVDTVRSATEELAEVEGAGVFADRTTDAKIRQQKETLQRHEFFRDCLAAPTVQLKLAAQVMLLRNLELQGGASRMLVNGSRGVVSDVKSADECKAEMRAEIAKLKSSGIGGDAIAALQRRLSSLEASQHTTVPVVTFRNGIGARRAAVLRRCARVLTRVHPSPSHSTRARARHLPGVV